MLLAAEEARAALGSLGLCCCLTLSLGAPCSRRARSRALSPRPALLPAPGAARNLDCAVTGRWVPRAVGSCQLHWVLALSALASTWLGAAAARRACTLPRGSRARRRAGPPARRAACTQAAVIYFLTSLFSTWMTFLITGRVHAPRAGGGRALALLALPHAAAAPRAPLRLSCVCARMLRGKLLPTPGRTRALSTCFLRAIFPPCAPQAPAAAAAASAERSGAARAAGATLSAALLGKPGWSSLTRAP